MAPPKDRFIGRVDFPLYTISVISERHVLVAGGGGKAKTGVANKIEILEIIPEEKGNFRAEVACSHDTGDTAIMNSAVCNIKDSKHMFVATGKGEVCELYRIKYSLKEVQQSDNPVQNGEVKVEKDAENSQVRKRKKKKNEAAGDVKEDDNEQTTTKSINANSLKLGFDIMSEIAFQSDFNNKEEPFQKSVTYAPTKGVVLTGGSDGYLRAWKSPTFNKLFEVKAHSDQVDGITVSAQDESIVTISKGGQGCVWNFEGKKLLDLELNIPVKDKYNYRSCKFGIVEGDTSVSRLFALLNPVVRKKPPQPTYIVKWNPHKGFTQEKIKATGTDPFSAMDISNGGTFLGVGRLSGTVEIFISFSLERLYVCEKSHNIFVTDVAFLRSASETRRLTRSDATLVSVSVDNLVKAHCIPPQASMGIVSIASFFICFLIIVYILLNYLGL